MFKGVQEPQIKNSLIENLPMSRR